MDPKTLDHVAFWLADRDSVADFATTAELEAFMGLGTGSLATRGPTLLGQASGLVRRFTRQDLEATGGRQESYAGDVWRGFIQLTQVPVTAVSSVTIATVAFTTYTWTRWGMVTRDDGLAWSDGPILVTYDSGYATTDDEYVAIKGVVLECAARAIGGNPETYGLEAQELRGTTPALFLTDEEKAILSGFQPVAVG